MRTLVLLALITVLVVTRYHRIPPADLPDVNTTVAPSSYFAETPIDVTADEYRLAYDANEVAADSRYLYRLVNLSGMVQAIKSATGAPYLVLRTAADPQGIHARFHAQFSELLALITKGDSVVVACRGGATANGVPTFHNCTLTRHRSARAADHAMGWSMGW